MNTLMKKFDQMMTWLSYWVHHLSLFVFTPHNSLKNGTIFPMKYLYILVIVVILVTIVWALIQYRTKVRIKERLHYIKKLFEVLSMGKSIEENLGAILDVFSEIIKAPYLAFYIWDETNSTFILRAVSHPYDLFEGVSPSYSGLALPKKEEYLPPSTLESPDVSDDVVHFRDGDVPLILIAIGKQLALIRIGPVESKLSKNQLHQLRELSEMLVSSLTDYLKIERFNVELEIKTLADKAVNKIAGLSSNTKNSITLLIQAFTGIVGGIGGFYIERDIEGNITIHAPDELSDISRELESEPEAMQSIVSLSELGYEHIIQRQEDEFYDLPAPLVALDEIQAVIVVPLNRLGTLFMLQDRQFSIDRWNNLGKHQLQLLTEQVNQLSRRFSSQQNFSKGYIRILCEIADFVDNLNPYTVGHSDMMMHYSLVIGHEMGLSDTEMRDLALAARLNNIGVIGMDTRLLVKQGRYTDIEHNLMKHHPEIGASMIELVAGNLNAAKYVLCHHERVDGHGYPKGLSSSNIPIPSKIIAVVQAFLAKINGRSWRTPRTFSVAIQELQSSINTSLDKDVVTAFINWWEKAARRRGFKGNNLGFCFEMCCVPQYICEQCPASFQPLRCWEAKDNLCHLHGRECSTCFVKSEYEHRTKNSFGIVINDGGIANVKT